MARKPSIARRVAWAAGCVCAAGCVVTNKAAPIKLSDEGETAAAARALWRFDPQEGSGIEVEAYGQRARGTASLPAGERVELGGTVIQGPDALRTDAKVRTVHVAYNRLLRGPDRFEAEFFAGAGEMDLNLQVRGSTPAARISRTFGGGAFVFGLEPRWKFGEKLALQGRWAAFFGADSRTNYDCDRIELSLAYRTAAPLSLRAGYAWIKADVDHDGADSDVSVRSRGPFLGVTLEF